MMLGTKWQLQINAQVPWTRIKKQLDQQMPLQCQTDHSKPKQEHAHGS